MKQYSQKKLYICETKGGLCKGNQRSVLPKITSRNQSCYSMRSRKKAIYLFCVLVLGCVEVSVRDVVVLYRGPEIQRVCGLTLSKSCLLI
jgi:hypothetical protein